MKIEILYGNNPLLLPGAAPEKLPVASEADWRLLLLLCARDERARQLREDFDPAAAADALELSVQEVEEALAFWRGAGILRLPRASSRRARSASPEKEEEKAAKAAKAPAPAPAPEPAPVPPQSEGKEEDAKGGEIPLTVLHSDSEVHYTGAELDGVVRKRPEIRLLLEECQHVAEKLFSTAESCKIITLADYYRLSPEYILMLFQYSQTVGKCSVPYVYRTGCELFRREIRSTEQLEDYFREQEQKHTVTGTVRRLFGIGSRALSSKEKRFMEAWARAGFSDELITYAYEQTVDAAGEPSLPYMNKILEKWKEAGIVTLAAAQEAEAEYRNKKTESGKPVPEKPGTGKTAAQRGKARRESEKAGVFHSFDPDEFLRTALARSDEEAARIRAEEAGTPATSAGTPATSAGIPVTRTGTPVTRTGTPVTRTGGKKDARTAEKEKEKKSGKTPSDEEKQAEGGK